MTVRIPSYPKVHAIGHAEIPDLLDGFVFVQEKYDGSQLSWGWDEDGGLHVRSKGKEQYPDTDKMFQGAVDYLLTLTGAAAPSGMWFRGEWISKPKHNALTYGRTPRHGIIVYDAEAADAPSSFWNETYVRVWAKAMDLEVAVVYWEGRGTDLNLPLLKELAERSSLLGGPMEGVVIKNYTQFKRDDKVQMGKYVREEFKEVHKQARKAQNPDIVEGLALILNTERRWEKAVEYLRDQGVLTGTAQDIGPLMKRVKYDTVEEERDFIVEQILKHLLPKLGRKLGRGLPEWYKERLAKEAFSE